MQFNSSWNILGRIVFVLAILIMSVFVFFHPKKTETNILNAILSKNEQDTLMVDLSKKQSAKINVVFESNNIDSLFDVAENFFSSLNKDVFYTNEIDVENVLSVYKKHFNNLISANTEASLKKKDYEAVVKSAQERLYNPVDFAFLPLQDDPFLLFGDYIKSLGNRNDISLEDIDGQYYQTAEIFVKKDIALSPSLLNVEISKLIKLKETLSKSDTQIYLSGAPMHTYFASSKSMNEINIICVLSSVFIILICKFYFKSFKILFPILISLGLGFYTGFLAVSILFDSIHVLTFVFASTLIGICVDYSLHYFAHNKDLNSIFNSLTQSLLTTVCAFLVLLLSEITLLRQIAVYTSVGLITVYLFVVLFYPLICRNIEVNGIKLFGSLKFSQTQKKIICLFFLIVIICGLFNLKFNDNIKDMYVPPKTLATAEKLYAKISHKNFNYTFITINADGIQNLLEKEEKIAEKLSQANIEYYALSRFIPSVNKQKQNIKLRQDFYKQSLAPYAEFLSPAQIKHLLHTPSNYTFLTIEQLNLPQLSDFLLSSQISVMVVNSDMSNEILKPIQNVEGTQVINLKKDVSQKVKNCRKICLILFVPVLILLFGLLAFIYKPLNALKIMSPSCIGTFFAFSLAGLVSQGINLFHVLAIFLIIGFSIDYSIFRFNGRSGINSEENASAVFISCATTVFSFFLLSMTSFKLISSLGFVLWVGILSSYILSILIISDSCEEQTDNE